jgi:hypothetical protein
MDLLSEVQLFVIATLAMVIVYLVKLWANKSGKSLGRGWLTAILYVLSVGLALLWKLPVFQPFPAPLQSHVYGGDVASYVAAWLVFFMSVLTAIGPLVAYATLIYNTLGKKVFEQLGEWTQARLG